MSLPISLIPQKKKKITNKYLATVLLSQNPIRSSYESETCLTQVVLISF